MNKVPPPAKPAPHRYAGLLATLILAPLALIGVKLSGFPLGDFLSETISLGGLPEDVQRSIGHVLFIPLAAIFVVFTRLTLGIRVLGPFRSILLAWAFKYTGIVTGTFFLVLTVATLVALRSPVKSLKLPYFGRITVMLGSVAAAMTAVLLISQWAGSAALHSVTHLPVVVLCLISEAFATKVSKEGQLSAVWKMTTTVVLAMGISLLASWPQLRTAMVYFPELLLVQIGLIVIVSRFCAFRLFDAWNLGQDDDDEVDALLEQELVTDNAPATRTSETTNGWSNAAVGAAESSPT